MAVDCPVPVEDTSWLAVKGGTVEALVRVLSLSAIQPATWEHGIEVVGGEHFDCKSDWAELACVYITPMVRGWRLVVGSYLGAGPATVSDDDPRTSWKRVGGWCRRLSREFGQAHAFTDQAQMDWFSWILARDGSVFRQAVFEDGEYLSNRGKPAGREARLIARFRPDELSEQWRPDVGHIPLIASEHSVNPGVFSSRTRCVGQGFVAVTPWGQSHGVVLHG